MHLKAVLRPSASSDNNPSREAADDIQRRSAQRRSLELSTVASSTEAGETRVLVRDISPGGILIEAEAPALCVEDWVEVHLPNLGVAHARVVWTSGRFSGCEFSDTISTSAVSAALLKARPPAQEETVFDESHVNPEGKRGRFDPTQNFAVAFLLAFALWALIAMVAFLLAR